jgi:hypothetical protein
LLNRQRAGTTTALAAADTTTTRRFHHARIGDRLEEPAMDAMFNSAIV